MNPFESGERKLIPAVLVYVRAGGRILMLHRNKDRVGAGASAGSASSAGKSDYHAGKWNGLGGKLELDESPLEGARRELREESGLELPVESFRALGTLQFPNFKAHKSEDWLVWVFVADAPERAREQSHDCPEGELHWIPENELMDLNLWSGDRHFIPWVVARKPFIGTLWYEGQTVTRWWVEALGDPVTGKTGGQ